MDEIKAESSPKKRFALKFLYEPFCLLSTIAALLYLYFSYGYQYSTIRLVIIAIAFALLIWNVRFFYHLRLGLLPWCIAAVISVSTLCVDRFFEGQLFIWKHKHTNLFLGGAPLYEVRAYQGRIIYLFDGGFVDPAIYALRVDRSWFPEYGDVQNDHRRGNDLPEPIHWKTYRRY